MSASSLDARLYRDMMGRLRCSCWVAIVLFWGLCVHVGATSAQLSEEEQARYSPASLKRFFKSAPATIGKLKRRGYMEHQKSLGFRCEGHGPYEITCTPLEVVLTWHGATIGSSGFVKDIKVGFSSSAGCGSAEDYLRATFGRPKRTSKQGVLSWNAETTRPWLMPWDPPARR